MFFDWLVQYNHMGPPAKLSFPVGLILYRRTIYRTIPRLESKFVYNKAATHMEHDDLVAMKTRK